MRYLCFHRIDESAVHPTPELFAEMGKLIEEMARAGVLVSTGGLQPSSSGSRIRLAAGKVAITDGPFTETKEVVAGFAIVDVKSKAEAIQWSTRFARIIGDCEVEVRLMFEQP